MTKGRRKKAHPFFLDRLGLGLPLTDALLFRERYLMLF